MSFQDDVNNVRFLVGDTDKQDLQLTNENILFALTQAGDDIYRAAAICARALAGKYSREVDTEFESISSDYSQLAENYHKLARRLEHQANKYGAGLGVSAGGLTYSDMDAADQNPDRVKPKFRQDQFANPPRGFEGDKYGY